MEGEATVKVPDGKMVKVEAEYTEVFEDVKITGDFFLEPPEGLEDIEEAIEGLPVDAAHEKIVEKLKQLEVYMIGFSPEDVAEAVKEAVE